MLYSKTIMRKYLDLLIRLRIFIVLGITFLTVILFFTMNKPLIHDDVKLWLEGSEEYNRVLNERYPQASVIQLKMPYKNSDQDVAKLQKLQISIQDNSQVLQVVSPFSHLNMKLLSDDVDSQMLKISTLLEANPAVVREYINNNEKLFQFFIDNGYMSFFIISEEELTLLLPNEAQIIRSDSSTSFFDDLLLVSILLAIIFLLFAIAFKNFLSSLMALLFIIPTTVITVSLFAYISPQAHAHVSILLIALTVSLMDFIYIYYKWHIFQKVDSPRNALYRAFSTTLRPIFWTSVISVFGLGILVFADSLLLNSIGLNIILSSISGFVLSFTWLLALLSFTRTKNPFSVTEKSSHYFASKEAHFHRTLLNGFLLATVIAFVYSVFLFYTDPITVITNDNSRVVKLAYKSDELTNKDLKYLEAMHSGIKKEFRCVEDVKSIYTEMKKIARAQNLSFNAEKVDIDHFMFMLDLYAKSDTLYSKGFVNIELFLDKENQKKAEIIQWLRDFDTENKILIADTASLLDAAKFDSIEVMFYVVAFVILFITLVVWFMTRDINFSIIALIVNVTPLTWFFTFVQLLNIPISTEILVAMIIAVALASDATIHFIHHYHFQKEPHSTVQMALERSFLHVGTPLGLGNSILGLVFLLMILVAIKTIAMIGLYSGILVVLSLLTDLFVLPVLFIKMVLHEKGHA